MALSKKRLIFVTTLIAVGCARNAAPPPASPSVPSSSPATASTVRVSVAVEGGGYSIDDLRALANRGDWAELAAHAEDVHPAQRDAAWQELTDRAVIASSKTTLAQCLDEGGEKRCTEKLWHALERHGSDTDAYEAGKIVSAHYGGGPAMPFFEQSLTGPSGRTRCDDDVVMRAMFEALEARSPGPEDAKKVQATCRALRKKH